MSRTSRKRPPPPTPPREERSPGVLLRDPMDRWDISIPEDGGQPGHAWTVGAWTEGRAGGGVDGGTGGGVDGGTDGGAWTDGGAYLQVAMLCLISHVPCSQKCW